MSKVRVWAKVRVWGQLALRDSDSAQEFFNTLNEICNTYDLTIRMVKPDCMSFQFEGEEYNVINFVKDRLFGGDLQSAMEYYEDYSELV
jgi:hypothetical protein